MIEFVTINDILGTNSNELCCVKSTDTMVMSTNLETKCDNWGNDIEFSMSSIAMSFQIRRIW